MRKRVEAKAHLAVASSKLKVQDKGGTLQKLVQPDEAAVRGARNLLKPSVSAVCTIANYHSPTRPLDLGTMLDQLNVEIAAVQNDDFSRPEGILTAHALTLDKIFHSLAQRAASNASENIHAFETYLRMALKAQAQCRSTLETLAELRHPKSATFIRQANVAQQQQVNNRCTDGEMSVGTREKKIVQTNELLRTNYGERMDKRPPSQAGRTYTEMAPLGALHRPKK